ncbi:FecR family protein [Bradyrhizobium sp. A11]|uniref:FecR family protein n=1 Tax=Bradyrhizobium sp. A11 TaxID=3133974 RepID=UPI0032560F27
MLGRIGMRCALVALALGTASGAFAAEDGVWSISRATGEVWVATDGARQVALSRDDTLKPGNTIRTGRNGRVLLVRGEETILISPNSVVGLPAEKKEGLSTTIIQQAGSILLEVEKRNVKHFEVETPYLAAVVKGTQFSVTVEAGSTKVGVLRGQVEVSDFRTGQIAQVMPGQAATVFEQGKPGLSLSGAGKLSPIEQGKPRAPTIERVPVPRSGLTAPRNAATGHSIHALGPIDKGSKAAGAAKASGQAAAGHAPKAGVVRISTALGEVKLNVHKATRGLAHGGVPPGQARNANARADSQTVWNDGKTSPAASNGAAAGGGASANATIAATTAGASSDAPRAKNGDAGGNGNSGNNNGNGGNNGNNGNNGNSGNSGNSGNNGNGGSGHANNGATGNGRGNNGNGGGNGSNGHAYGRR